MKSLVRYFEYITEQAFKTGPNGERLYCRGGLWSRPHIIPDSDTERRLFRKQLWMFQLTLPGAFICMIFLYFYLPVLRQEPKWFAIVGAALVVVYLAIDFVVFHPELRRLHRVPARLPLKFFVSDMARRHNIGQLFWGVVGCMAYLSFGVLMLFMSDQRAIALLFIALMGAATAFWWYALQMKQKSCDPSVTKPEPADIPSEVGDHG